MPSRCLPGVQSVGKPSSLRGQPCNELLQKHCSSVFSCMLVLWKVQAPRARGPNLSVTGQRLLHSRVCEPTLVHSRSDTVQEDSRHVASYNGFRSEGWLTYHAACAVAAAAAAAAEFQSSTVLLPIALSLTCMPYSDRKQPA